MNNPGNNGGVGAARPQNNNNNGRGGENNPFFHFQNRLFHALFYRIAITYARAFPRPARRVLEFALLFKVRAIFFISNAQREFFFTLRRAFKKLGTESLSLFYLTQPHLCHPLSSYGPPYCVPILLAVFVWTTILYTYIARHHPFTFSF